MMESLILVEGSNVKEEDLRRLSLGNALQIVVGSVPASGVVVHVAATTAADLSAALIDFAKVANVTQVVTLTLKTSRLPLNSAL
jgi:hypothetical protein